MPTPTDTVFAPEPPALSFFLSVVTGPRDTHYGRFPSQQLPSSTPSGATHTPRLRRGGHALGGPSRRGFSVSQTATSSQEALHSPRGAALLSMLRDGAYS